MPGSCVVPRHLLLPRRYFSSCRITRSRNVPVLWRPTPEAPDNATALHIGPFNFGMSVIENMPRFRHLEHIQFEKYTMAYFDDRRLTDILSRSSIKSASFTSSIFRTQQHFYSFLRLFPMLEELSCIDLHFKKRPRAHEIVEVRSIGPSLRQVMVDSGDLWQAALDGSRFGPIDKLQKVTIVGVGLDDLAKVAQFLRKTKNTLEEFSMGHLHILGHKHSIHVRWKSKREPLMLSHLRNLTVDIHGKERFTGLPDTDIVIRWWLSMLQDMANANEAHRLENLTIIVGISRSISYIQQNGGASWQEFDRCLTKKQFSAFKSFHVVIKVFSPMQLRSVNYRKQMILDNCPRLQEKGMIDVVVQSVDLPEESVG
ncbi:uncharacterized protein BT62DRAFT_1006661 [Guyanagaster necrorhizus]|uniref:Uncharacterized protein n=1 Tax=Guyanagaster necrorhizus TaxID=856835 RepID=A0A9P7VS73_9AGAR|nr:uncharacterized protein BT62DRAFT_1006661 [Guyanagaster necrorhizus MCA 3950]KAG7445632.1 hypothetical protein BT62DRAFT_1006661 [Guyanagaster necrorhizus MCA 3950]